jgi:hypothetical protein
VTSRTATLICNQCNLAILPETPSTGFGANGVAHLVCRDLAWVRAKVLGVPQFDGIPNQIVVERLFAIVLGLIRDDLDRPSATAGSRTANIRRVR